MQPCAYSPTYARSHWKDWNSTTMRGGCNFEHHQTEKLAVKLVRHPTTHHEAPNQPATKTLQSVWGALSQMRMIMLMVMAMSWSSASPSPACQSERPSQEQRTGAQVLLSHISIMTMKTASGSECFHSENCLFKYHSNGRLLTMAWWLAIWAEKNSMTIDFLKVCHFMSSN